MAYSVLGVVSFASRLDDAVSAVKSSIKMVGLAKDLGSKCCSALFYRGVATAYSYGSTERSKNLYKDYYIRSASETGKTGDALLHFLTYFAYGKEVVGFSSNPGERFCDAEARMKFQGKSLVSQDRAPLSLETLNERYGADEMERWYAWYRSLDLMAKAPPMHLPEEGCCFGMVCDFITAYAQNRISGKSAKDSVASIAHHFTLGASDKAQIAQIFYQSILYAIKKSPFGQEVSEKRKQISPLVSAIARGELSADAIDDTAKATLDRVYRLSLLFVAQQNTFMQKVEQDQFGLLSMPSFAHSFTKSADRQFQQFLDFVNGLPPAMYRVKLTRTDERIPPHFIAFIKAETGERFIFNPASAILAVDPELTAQRLWQQGIHYGYESFEFIPVVTIKTEEVGEEIDDDKEPASSGLVQRKETSGVIESST